MWVQDEEQFGNSRSSHPGCMSGIFHALDYHYWHSNVKKMFPHRKHEDFIKHTNRNRRYRRISDDQDPYEVLRLLDAKTSHIQMDQRNRKKSSTQKRSLKARIKALVSENNDKEQDQDFVPIPKLHRTLSIHHLESNEWVNPISFFPENVTESPASSATHSNVTHHENKDSQDILDMLEVDKELFINTLQGRSQASVMKPKLIKSGSFPSPYKSGSLMPLKLKDKLNETYTVSKSGKIKNSNEDLNSNNILRKVSSLNESADRYAQLFDFSVGKEAILRSSRSLKLTNGSESVLGSQQLSFFRRNDTNKEHYDERNPVSLSLGKDKYAELDSTQDCDSLHEVVDKREHILENQDSSVANTIAFSKDSDALKNNEENHQISQVMTQQIPDLVPVDCPPDEKVQISEGLDLLSNLHENTKKEMKTVSSKNHMDLSMQDDDSSTQPLDPLLFQELESQYSHDPERFAEEINELSHHLLIFDLVDEVLLTMCQKSLTYYPKKLSSFCHIRPALTGSRVLDEVWNRVSQMINLKHDMNETLDDIVSRDLKSDGWMKLQKDSECVGLDLEDLILDEVLEEMLLEFF